MFFHVGFFVGFRKVPAAFRKFDLNLGMEECKMLVLSRKNRESIVVDGRITVTVLAVRGNVVRIGIDAPKEIQVRRSELHERIRETERTLVSP